MLHTSADIERDSLPYSCSSWVDYARELHRCLGPQLVAQSLGAGIADRHRRMCCLYTTQYQCSRFAFRNICHDARVVNYLLARRWRPMCGQIYFHLPRLACLDDRTFALVGVGFMVLGLGAIYLAVYVLKRVHYVYFCL